MINTFLHKLTIVYIFLSNLFLHFWINFTIVYFVLVRDCFEIILWGSIILKERFVWILQELNGGNLYRAILEKTADNSEPLFSDKDAMSVRTPKSQSASRNCAERSKETYEVYMCQSCRKINQSFIMNKYVRLKTPTQVKTGESVCANSCPRSYPLNNHKRKSSLDIYQNPWVVSEELCGSCQTPKFVNSTQNQNELKYQNGSNKSLETQSSCKSINANQFPQSQVQNGMVKDELQALPESVDEVISTKSNSSTDPMLLETPISNFKISRKCILELMNTEEKKPEVQDQTFLKKNWNKFAQSLKRDTANTERKDSSISTISQHVSSTKSETKNAFGTEAVDLNLQSEIQTPELSGCCTVLTKLKSKFSLNLDGHSVSYKRF